MNDGGIIDATGKFVYTCPTCRAHLNISATMVQDSDVKTKLYNYFLHEVENCNVDNARNMRQVQMHRRHKVVMPSTKIGLTRSTGFSI